MALRRAHGMHHDADLREVLEEKAEGCLAVPVQTYRAHDL